jgi:hypothetical protein
MNAIRSNRLLLILAAATAVTLVAGCAAPWSTDWHTSDMFDLKKPWPFKDDDGPKKGTPVRMASTWTDTVMTQTGKTPQRGFGGRVMFYGKDGNEPILVDGQFVVYAFDETNREPTDNKPTRRYVFPADQVAIRMSKSELGAGYSFWLPWDEVGGPQTTISLICRFEPKKGGVVVGEQTQHLLPGALRPTALTASNTPPKLPDGTPMRPAIRQMSYTTPAPANGTAPINSESNNQVQAAVYQPDTPSYDTASLEQAQRRMTTTSITLPESFQRRSVSGASQSSGAISAADHMQSLAAPLPVRNHAAAPAAAQVAMAQPAAAPQQLPRPPVAAVQPAAATPPANRFAQPGASLPTAFQAFSPAEMPMMQPPNNNFTPAASGPQAFRSQQPVQPNAAMNAAGVNQAAASPSNRLGSQLPTQAGVTTTVSYLPVGASSRPGMIPLPSFGSAPATPQAPATPAFQ